MKNMLAEFKDFIAKGSLIDLAIAVVLATFFVPVVAAIVDGVILNLVAAIFGKPDFSSVARLKVRDADGEVPATYLEFGMVLTAIVTFVIVGFVCFMIIKAYNKMQPPEEAAPAGPTEVELLTEIRDSLRANS